MKPLIYLRSWLKLIKGSKEKIILMLYEGNITLVGWNRITRTTMEHAKCSKIISKFVKTYGKNHPDVAIRYGDMGIFIINISILIKPLKWISWNWPFKKKSLVIDYMSSKQVRTEALVDGQTVSKYYFVNITVDSAVVRKSLFCH